METSIGAETAKLAGLYVDLGQKLRNGQLTLGQIEWLLNLRSDVRDRFMQPDFHDVVRGLSRIVAIEHIIDCDADPFVPEGWTVESHKKGGRFEWKADRIALHLADGQKSGKWMRGNDLRKELESQPVLNACVLDYLLAHQELIPEEWKGKYVFFWGTVYCGSDGDLHVRYLYWNGLCWYWRCRWFERDFSDRSPAACSQVSSN